MSDDNRLLDKAYDPTEAENRWYNEWQQAGVFSPDNTSKEETYVIMMPPPNVTGSLHMGHALTITIQDMLIRYHRMLGKNTLYLPGTDHAGIATQTVVERELLRTEQKTRHDLGRDAFLERVWDWKEKNGNTILKQLRTIGASADWDRLRFTMDDQCSTAVKEAFVRMWNDDLIYRGERLVNWDPKTQTALSDEEVEHEEHDGEMWRFAYPVKGQDKELVVATTRPETMLGDTAVAVHPEDERYQDLVGQELAHPFFPERKVIVVADDYVDREFGTGAVKITPAHDPNDFEIGQRHNLPMINILTLEAKINENGGDFQGQDRYEARKNVKQAIEDAGLFRGTEAIKHNVSISQRSGVVVEPMLSRQYFVKGKPLADKAMAAINSQETRIIPESWTKTWNHFMTNIRDWCISRQLWWGHRIPVFYDLNKLQAAIEEDAANKGIATEALNALKAGESSQTLLQIALTSLSDDLVRSFSVASTEDLVATHPDQYVQEEDVLDTWFSSGLWPFSTLGWPENTDDLKTFYPGAVLETGFDILFFWVARMVMMGTYFMGDSPFKDVYLHAMVRDSQGRKMSKSLGNTIDPLDVIGGITLDDLVSKTETYPVPEKLLPKVIKGLKKEYPDGIPSSGADGLRFTLASLSGQGRDIKLSIPRVAGYRAFLNKIWNATRFALMRLPEGPVANLNEVRNDLNLADRWILSQLQEAIAKANHGMSHYRFDEVANTIYHFFWNDFCDWYIELSKSSLSDEASEKQKKTTASVLVHVLDESMRLLHPICPFQSEEIWQKLPGITEHWAAQNIHFCARAPYPQKDDTLVDNDAVTQMQWVQNAITLIRNTRQESGLPAQKKVPVHLLVSDEKVKGIFQDFHTEMMRLALLTELQLEDPNNFETPKYAATNASENFDLVIPLEGLIDLDAERSRLQKEIEKVQKEAFGLGKRLGNEKFVAQAPPEVVAQAKQQHQLLEEKRSRLEASLTRLS